MPQGTTPLSHTKNQGFPNLGTVGGATASTLSNINNPTQGIGNPRSNKGFRTARNHFAGARLKLQSPHSLRYSFRRCRNQQTPTASNIPANEISTSPR